MNMKYILSSISILLSVYLEIILLIGISFVGLLTLRSIIFLSLFIVILTIVILKMYFSKKARIYNFGVFITFFINIVTLYNVYTLNNEYRYLDNIINNKFKYVTYNVYVQKKNTSYNELEKLDGKKIGLLTNKDNISFHLNKKASIECVKFKNVEELALSLENGEVQSVILNENEYYLLEKYTNLSDKTRIIYTNKIIDTI